MRFLPENKKKTIQSLVILAVALGGIVYFNLFTGPSAGTRRPPDEIVKPAELPAQDDGSPISGVQSTPVSGSAKSKLLPYGPKIDLSVLAKDAFKILKAFPRLTVSQEELGKSDPFAQ